MLKSALKLLAFSAAFWLLSNSPASAPENVAGAQQCDRQGKAAVNSNGTLGNSGPPNDEQVRSAPCDEQMAIMRNSFIEARHRAMAGDSCETAALVSSFLKAYEECQEICPPNHLNKNGFTGHIVRNMQWLGSYSARKCSSATPADPP
jgi:hypothetical protein